MNFRDITQAARRLGIANCWVLGDPASGECEVQWHSTNYDQAFEQAYQLAGYINARVDRTADERFVAAKGQFYVCYQRRGSQPT